MPLAVLVGAFIHLLPVGVFLYSNSRKALPFEVCEVASKLKLMTIDHDFGSFGRGIVGRTPSKQRHRTQDWYQVFHGRNPTAGRKGVSRWGDP